MQNIRLLSLVKSFIVVASVIFSGFDTQAQSLPFFLELQQADAYELPAIHSFAKAQSGNKWLVVAGRVDGLHSLFPGQAFQPNMANDQLFVIDTSSWQVWSSSVYNLPYVIRQSLQATNAEFFQRGNYLYVIGGFGYDSVNDIRRTYGTLTALDVNGLVNEISAGGNNLSPHVRQINDTIFAVTGGKLEMLGDKFYLVGGQYFDGLYTKDFSTLFTQRYTNAISSFFLNDDGVNLTVTDFTTKIDTENFHRRDLNAAPVIVSDSLEEIGVYGGVFQYGHNTPFQNPVYITEDAITNDLVFQQKMSQYTCATIPLYDSIEQNMYTIFFAGISLYSYDEAGGNLKLDTLVPFINDVSTLIRHDDGSTEEVIMPITMAELGGANTEFFQSESAHTFSNGVIKLRSLEQKTLLGYLYGGITAEGPNESNTAASNKVYRVFLTPDFSSGISTAAEDGFRIYPNPANDFVSVIEKNSLHDVVSISITDIFGNERKKISPHENAYVRMDVSDLATGFYSVLIQTPRENVVRKLAVVR